MERRGFAKLAGAIGAAAAAPAPAAAQASGEVWSMGRLSDRQAESGRPYLPFLRVPALHCGVYALAAGAEDKQRPHTEDEVYYVEAGQAKILIDGTDHDVRTGDVIYVAAQADHRFHSIEEDLKLLVFFSTAPVEG